MPTTLAELNEAFADYGSTFEFCRDWLVSSETFVRLAMGADAVDLDGARDQARARIHREENYIEPDEAEEGESAPDLPAPVNDRPWAIVITRDNERSQVGTGTWSGTGQLLVCLEVLTPTEHLPDANDTQTDKSTKVASAHEWASRLCEMIRRELMATSGQGSADGRPYLNARDIGLYVAPGFAEDGEPGNYMAWIYEVTWR